jgi:hypothetical protein
VTTLQFNSNHDRDSLTHHSTMSHYLIVLVSLTASRATWNLNLLLYCFRILDMIEPPLARWIIAYFHLSLWSSFRGQL